MLTTGEAITYALRFWAGTDSASDQQHQRDKARFFLQEAGARAWSKSPAFYKLADGSVTIGATDGNIACPNNFETFGISGDVYISGKQQDPLGWLQPEALQHLLQTSSGKSNPTHYTLKGKSATGASMLYVFPVNGTAVTLLLKNYVRRAPALVDYPNPAVTGVADGVGSNLTGAYRYKVTFVTADGETEPGPASASVTVTSDGMTVSGIPVSPVRTVTSRKLYRTIASGAAYLLLATISDNTTTTYTDDIADGSLGAAAPTVGSAVTGLEVFPETFHETVLVQGVIARLMRAQGDLRDGTALQEWERDVVRMWSEMKQGRNVPQGMRPYGQNVGSQGRRWRLSSA